MRDVRFEVCGHCDGYGAIGRAITAYEPGCAWPHSDTEESPCPECSGTGECETEVEPVTLDDLK